MKKILVIDFGGQYAHLIAKRLRSLSYYSEIALPDIDPDQIGRDVQGIILSGGPASIYDQNIPDFNDQIFELDLPILGLCYGHHLMARKYGGKVEPALTGEYGLAILNPDTQSQLFDSISFPAQVWMSHSDEVTRLPAGFDVIGSTGDCAFAAMVNARLKRYGLQFHAEVQDTLIGLKIFENFAAICAMPKNWDSSQVVDHIQQQIKGQAGDKKVLLFLSGGVDSSVAFALLNEVLGKERVLGLYIDNGFMRKNETRQIAEKYQAQGYDNFIIEEAQEHFLKAVKDLIDPQAKRQAIGDTFIKVRDQVVARLNLDEQEWLLAQGTLYPDIIESGGTQHSTVIKTHHNRVDGIKQLLEKGLVIEPLKELYKDEVRQIGLTLGLSREIVFRHPFPGPGIAINLLCSQGRVNENELLNLTRQLKTIDLTALTSFESEIYPIPVKSVGVQGDFRTYTYPCVWAINDFFHPAMTWDQCEQISSYITNHVKEVNRTIIRIFEKGKLQLFPARCTKERLDMIREVDDLVLSVLKVNGWYDQIFQHLTINLPYALSSRHCAIVLRPVISEDVMTARFARLDFEILKEISRAIEQFTFVDALYYDISNKPPATFGWE